MHNGGGGGGVVKIDISVTWDRKNATFLKI